MTQPKEEMKKERALQILIQACVKAQSDGCYALDQAAIISKAVRKFLTFDENNVNTDSKRSPSNKLDTITEQIQDNVDNKIII